MTKPVPPHFVQRARLRDQLMERHYPGVDQKEISEEISRRERKEDLVPDQLVTEAIKYLGSLKLLLSKTELEAALKEKHAPVDKESQLFLNRAESFADSASWGHWLRMVTWTSPQATALSLGRKPERVTLEIARKFEKQSTFARTFIARHDLIHNAIISGTLSITHTMTQAESYMPLLRPKNIALWANDLDLDVPDEIKGLIEDREPQDFTGDLGEPQGFKDMEALNWEDITLTLLRGDDIQASAKNLTKRVSLSTLNLVSRRGTKKTNERFALLVAWVQGGRADVKTTKARRDHIYKLRKSLKAYFGITTNPIPVEGAIYTPRFHLIDKRDAGDKRAKERARRKTVSLDETNLAHHGILDKGPPSISEEKACSESDEYPFEQTGDMLNDPAAEFLRNKRRD